MSLTTGIRQFFDRAWQDGLTKATADQAAERDAYFPPSDEPLEYDRSGVVPLHLAVFAVRMATARIFLRTLPVVFKARLERTKEQLEEGAVKAVFGFALIQALKRLIFFLKFAYDTWSQVKIEMEFEKALRAAMLATYREVPGLKFKSEKHPNRRKEKVASRRES